MEDQGKRLLLAVAIAFGIMMMWSWLFPTPPKPEPGAADAPAAEVEQRPGTADADADADADATAESPAAARWSEAPSNSCRSTVTRSIRSTSGCSTYGGALTSWELQNKKFANDGTLLDWCSPRPRTTRRCVRFR